MAIDKNGVHFFALSLSLSLSILEGKPEIDTPVDVFIAKEGGIITLNCSALGFPAPQFTWTPSGKEVCDCVLTCPNWIKTIFIVDYK